MNKRSRRLTFCVVAVALSGGVVITSCVAEELVPRGGSGRNALRYDRQVTLRGLDESVRVVKTPRGAVAIRPDGTRVGWRRLRELDRSAYRERFGPFVRTFHEELSRASSDDVLAAALYVRIPVDWKDISGRLNSSDPVTHASAIADLEDATASQGAALAAELEAAGLTVEHVGTKMPVLLVRGRPASLLALQHHPDARLVTPSEALAPELRCNGGQDKTTLGACDGDANVHHRVDSAFNASGIYGAGSRVGMLEDVGDCTLDETHEAFQYVPSMNYSNPSPASCVSLHGTYVASVIAASVQGTRCGASDVELYYANTGQPTYFPAPMDNVTSSACNSAATLDAYEWFAGIGSATDPEDPALSAVNESYGCIQSQINCNFNWARSGEGITQDYFARIYGLPIVKAAGNLDCDFQSEACPWTLNSICVGSSSFSDGMGTSSFQNPGQVSGLEPWDREEPDVLAVGGIAPPSPETSCVATPGGGWEGHPGTSFAAPVVTSMITLFREYCEPIVGYQFDQRILRALIRTAAWGANPDGPAYSTPKPGVDHKDGAGIIFADHLRSLCNSGQSGGFGPVNIDLEHGRELPVDDAPYQDDWTSPGETQRLHPQSFEHLPGEPGLVGESMFRVELHEGQRLRYTFSWDGCALDDTGDAPAGVATDFDVFLYNPAIGYVWGSQSLDDNNEGFDYTVPPGEGGSYEIYVAWPEGATGCDGVTNEAAAAAVAVLQ